MSSFSMDDFLQAKLSDKQAIDNSIDIIISEIKDEGNKTLFAFFDIPMSERYAVKTGFIESIHTLSFLVEYERKEIVNEILSKGLVYFTFPTGDIILEPFYVSDKTFSVFDKNSLNYYRFEITIKKASLSQLQTNENKPTLNDVKKIKKDVELSTIDKIKAFFAPVSDVIDLTTKAISDINTIMTSIYQSYTSVLNDITAFKQSIESLSNNIYALISIPSSLAATVDFLIKDFSKLANNTEDQIAMIGNFLTSYNFRTYNLTQSTIQRDEYVATYTLEEKLASNLFCAYCENICALEINSIDNAILLKQSIDDIFKKIDFIDDIDIKIQLSTCKNITNLILDEKISLIKPFTIIKSKGDNIYDFLYKYYGNIDNFDLLLKWNPNLTNIRWLEGDIKIII
jgi:hypothetical protein